jgi:DNA-binding CsgD family transcriptional regulator
LTGGSVKSRVEEVSGELSVREREVVHLLPLGLTSPEIAERLSISVQTVRTHVRTAMAKTGTKTRAHLVAVALADRRTLGAGD